MTTTNHPANVMLCLGNYAQRPYDWEQLDVRVYCIEELCFYIVRNRYLLGMDTFTEDLIDWIETECGLEELAIGLRRRYEAKCSVLEFATAILEYVRYNTQEEIAETRRVLKDNSDMNVYEKGLTRANYLMESAHFHQAMDVYEDLLDITPDQDKEMQARILLGQGRMSARMFSFSQAAERFRSAYEMTHDPEAYLNYMAALRMQMTEKEYLDYISEDAKGYQFSMSLETAISEAEEEYGLNDAYRQIKRLLQLKSEGKTNEYYALANEMTQELKRAYRGGADIAVKN